MFYALFSSSLPQQLRVVFWTGGSDCYITMIFMETPNFTANILW